MVIINPYLISACQCLEIVPHTQISILSVPPPHKIWDDNKKYNEVNCSLINLLLDLDEY